MCRNNSNNNSNIIAAAAATATTTNSTLPQSQPAPATDSKITKSNDNQKLAEKNWNTTPIVSFSLSPSSKSSMSPESKAKIYYDEIIAKQAQKFKNANKPSVGNVGGGSFNNGFGGGSSCSFVDKFTDFVINECPASNEFQFTKIPTIPSHHRGIITSNKNSGRSRKKSQQPRTVQLIVTRKPVEATTTKSRSKQCNNNNNSNIATDNESVDTTTTTVVIEEDDDELNDATTTELSAQQQQTIAALSASTTQILRKFRIPKGTALTAKISTTNDDSNSNTTAIINTDSQTSFSDNNTCDSPMDSTTASPIPDDSNTIIDENGGVIKSETTLPTVLLTATPQTQLAATSTPQQQQIQLQTVQPNGTVTCINLPPNTILLSSADGSILATTAPVSQHATAEQQQQPHIIAIQDWNNSGEVVNLTTAATAPNQATSAQPTTTTLLLTTDGTAIPFIQQSAASTAASSSDSTAAEALKAQVIA